MSVDNPGYSEVTGLARTIRSYLGRMVWFKDINLEREIHKMWKPIMIVEASEDWEHDLGMTINFVNISFYIDGEQRCVRVHTNEQFHRYFKLDDPR